MEKTEKIKKKIKALLSKTTCNGATKEEMEASLNKANELMIEFFITENDLKDLTVIEKCISKCFEITKSGYDLGIFYNDLACLFDCQYHYNSIYITFFGHEQDVELCGYFYSLITRTCLREKDNYLKSESYKDLKKYYHGKTLSSSFIKGFLIEISIKMQEMYSQKKSNIPQSYGLMVIEKKEKVEREFKEMDLKISIKKDKPLTGVKIAFNDGLEKGKSFNLTQGINSNREKIYL